MCFSDMHPHTRTRPAFKHREDKADGLRPALPKALWLETLTLTAPPPACASVPTAEPESRSPVLAQPGVPHSAQQADRSGRSVAV